MEAETKAVAAVELPATKLEVTRRIGVANYKEEREREATKGGVIFKIRHQ
jgi:hypothetical protein